MIATVTLMILCNNLNYQHSPRCMEPPAYFERTVTGWEGELVNGIPFTQDIITPYLHEFKMENVHYLIFNGEIIYVE